MEYQFRHKLPPDGFYRTESSETQEYMQQYELDEIDEDDAPIIESCCFCCSLSVGILFGALSFLVRKKNKGPNTFRNKLKKTYAICFHTITMSHAALSQQLK